VLADSNIFKPAANESLEDITNAIGIRLSNGTLEMFYQKRYGR